MHGVFADRKAASFRWILLSAALWATASLKPALAQSITVNLRPWYLAVLNLHALPYVLGSAVFCYLLSVVLTMIFLKSGYPPNVARFAIWLGLLLWLILQVGVIFRFIVFVAFPLWFLIALLLFVLAFGIILMTTKRQSA